MKFLVILLLVLFVAIVCVALFDKVTKSNHSELIEVMMMPMVFIGFWVVYCVIVP